MALSVGLAVIVGQVLVQGLPSATAGQYWSARGHSAQSAGAMVLGRVIEAGAGQPVSGARVTLRRENPPGPRGAVAPRDSDAEKAVLTTSAGYFLFRDIAAGRYSLLVRAPGYAGSGYLQSDPADSRVRTLELRDGERRGDLELRMWKLASIRGAVFDEQHAPLAGVAVRILRRWSASGRPRLGLAATLQTNDRGEYAASDLIPGEYVVGVIMTRATLPLTLAQRYSAAVAASPDPARPPPLWEDLRNAGVASASGTGIRVGNLILQTSGQLLGYQTPQASDGRLVAFASAYYQEASGLLASTPIVLGSGDERAAVDFTLRMISGVRVSGTLSDPQGHAEDVALRLVSEESDELMTDAGYETATTVTERGGRFTFLGVPPGRYVLKSARLPIVRSGVQASVVWARESLAVGDEDITGLEVSLKPGLRVSGRLEFAGGPPPPSDVLAFLDVSLMPAASGIAERHSAALARPDRTFETNGVLPGRYYVTATAPRGWTLRSIVHAGRNVADDPIELASTDATNLIVTFVDQVARVSGTIGDVNAASNAGFSVVLFPADSEGWRRGDFNPRRIRRATASAVGAFALEDVPSGQYYVVALSDTAIPSNWATPGFLERLVPAASKVAVAEGGSVTVSLRPIALKSTAR